ncbi:MAG: ShlB/FhaC/HecB family hemolysin secretion/activation protein [Gammaproteobacteria bacterium]
MLYALLATPAWAKSEPPPEAAPQFDIWEIRVRGNQLLTPRAVEGVIYPHLGPGRTIDDVDAARGALEAAYRDAGYPTVLVNIPEQDVVNGVVWLEVVEGGVERLRISGSRYFSLGRIRGFVPALAEGRVPHVPTVQKEIQALNGLSPDRKITPVLKPARSPGMTDVELVVEDELPLHGNLEFNGRNTKDTTRTRLGGGVRYDNLWQREHSVGFQFQLTPEDPGETKVYSGSYLFRVPGRQTLVALYGVSTDSDVFAGSDINVIGNGIIAGARVIQPLPSVAWGYHRFSVGFDYKDFQESVGLLGSDTFNTPISYHMFELGYTANRLGDTAETKFGINLDFALRNFGNTPKEFENKRFLAKPNFAYLTAELAHDQFLGAFGRLHFEADGQLAESPLISNEQFAVGGLESVRGYYETQNLTDLGIRTSLEYHSPSIGSMVWSGLSDLHGVLFVDAAHARVIDALPNQFQSFTLWSTGLGVEFGVLSYFTGRAYLAWALQENDRIERGDSRVHFDFDYRF